MNVIYLDHNATTPLAPEAAEAMLACERAGFGNAASQHACGRRARQLLEEAREGIGAILGADLQSVRPDTLVFTSGGTEANNLALFGLCGERPGLLIVSAIEHPSITEPAEQLARRGWELAKAPVSRDGIVEAGWIRARLEEHAARRSRRSDQNLDAVVSVMLGNNETGVLQPIAEIAAACRAVGALMHTDAVQVTGKLPVDFRELGVDAMSISAHKFHGPRGVGALLVRHGVSLQPQLFGGFQQGGLRPGTEPVALAVAMHAALRQWQAEHSERTRRMAALRDRFEAAVLAGCPGAVVHGAAVARLPHTSNISFPGLERQALQMALDMAGVACSTGSACASGSTDPSPVLLAMGCPKEQVDSSLRFSLGAQTTLEEVLEAARRMARVCNELRQPKNPLFSG